MPRAVDSTEYLTKYNQSVDWDKMISEFGKSKAMLSIFCEERGMSQEEFKLKLNEKLSQVRAEIEENNKAFAEDDIVELDISAIEQASSKEEIRDVMVLKTDGFILEIPMNTDIAVITNIFKAVKAS